MMEYMQIYKDKKLRFNFFNLDNGQEKYNRVATGKIVNEDDFCIVVFTVKGETVTIRKSNIVNIMEIVQK